MKRRIELKKSICLSKNFGNPKWLNMKTWVRDFSPQPAQLSPRVPCRWGASSDDKNPVVRTWGEAPRVRLSPQGPLGYRGETWASWILNGAAKITGASLRPPERGPGRGLSRGPHQLYCWDPAPPVRHGYTGSAAPRLSPMRDSLRAYRAGSPSFRRILFKLEGLNYFLIPTAGGAGHQHPPGRSAPGRGTCPFITPAYNPRFPVRSGFLRQGCEGA